MLINVGSGGIVGVHGRILKFLAVTLTEPAPTLFVCLSFICSLTLWVGTLSLALQKA